jgi:hypothetical protein
MRLHPRLVVFHAALVLALTAFATVAKAPVPTLVGPTVPQAVMPGGGAFTLKVYGANFVSGATVNWDGQSRATAFVSPHELQAVILASDIAKPTAGYITVTNPPPGGGVSSSSYAIVEVHDPTKSLFPGKTYVYGTEQHMGQVVVMVAADFNHDGVIDLAGGDGGARVFDYLGNGDGSFDFGSVVSGDYFFGSNLVFGDFRGDGDLGLGFTAGLEAPAVYQVRFGNGEGEFPAYSNFGHFSGGCACVTGDFNRDGYLDLIIGDEVFLGDEGGTFRRIKHDPVFAGFAEVVGDFNGDGKLDLVVENLTEGGSAAALYFVAGNDDGTFQKPKWLAAISESCTTNVLASDFNGDGKLDLVFCDLPKLGVMLGNGDGTFRHPVYYSSVYPTAFAAGDFNSDGDTDLLVNGGTGHTWILLGRGNGTFGKAQAVDLSDSGELGIVLGDFNSDGLLDFVYQEGGWGFDVHLQK